MYYVGNTLFVHIPKNSGTSVRVALRETLGGGTERIKAAHIGHHSPAWIIRRHLGHEWQDAETFAVVRNPWDRIVSLWCFLVYPAAGHPVHKAEELKLVRLDRGLRDKSKDVVKVHHEIVMRGFAWWLTEFCPETKWSPWHIFCTKSIVEVPQIHWLNDKGRQIVNRVYRFENLGELERDMGLALRQENVGTPRPHYSAFYNRKTRDWVAERFAEDIRRWGYRFETS